MGLNTAAVTVIEYGDYECSYCARANAIVRELQDRFGERMRYIFRNYPLVAAHPRALASALVAEAAKPDEFWTLHDLLFRRQDALDDASLIEYAVEVGIAAATARAAIDGSTMAKVQADMDSGNGSGVRGAPWFFVNGRHHRGDWSLPSLAAAVQEAVRAY